MLESVTVMKNIVYRSVIEWTSANVVRGVLSSILV